MQMEIKTLNIANKNSSETKLGNVTEFSVNHFPFKLNSRNTVVNRWQNTQISAANYINISVDQSLSAQEYGVEIGKGSSWGRIGGAIRVFILLVTTQKYMQRGPKVGECSSLDRNQIQTRTEPNEGHKTWRKNGEKCYGDLFMAQSSVASIMGQKTDRPLHLE